MAVKIYLANESEIIREGIKSLLTPNPIFIFCNESNSNSLMSDIEFYHPNIIFVDANTKNYELCRGLTNTERNRNRLYVAVIYKENDDIYSDHYHVNGLFSVNIRRDELYKGLLEMIRTGKYIYEPLKRTVIPKSEKLLDKAKINSLTKREMEVLILVSNGMFNKEIANELNISERTVKNHLFSIFKKIEVADRTQAAIFAIRNDIEGL